MHELREAGKEAARIVVLAVIPLLIVQLESGKLDWKVLVVTALVAGLRFADKFLHEKGKTENNDLLKKGLTQF